MYLLTGDIGGTHTRFRLLQKDREQWRIRHQTSWPSGQLHSLTDAAERYLSGILSQRQREAIAGAWLAVAGPVQNNRVDFSNLPWRADAHSLAEDLRLPAVHLVNDLAALAHAIPFLERDKQAVIQQGVENDARKLVIATGTGLGVATWQETVAGIEVFPSEGGHCDLAPGSAGHLDLLRYLFDDLEHVSYERVLSGPGLVTLYHFSRRNAAPPLPDLAATEVSATWVAEQARQGDPSARLAMTLFVELLGAFAGTLALQWLAGGGVYLAGGVTSGLYPSLQSPAFITAFHNKGRMRPLMERIPVMAITRADAGLEGISRLAISNHNLAWGS